MSDLRIDRIGNAARVRIDRPRRRNALTLPTVEHLMGVLDEEPSATVLLGSVTAGIFSAGADLDIDDVSRAHLSDLLYECYERMVSRPGVVIAVVDGPAVGGGAQLSAAADIRVISTNARWRWVGPGHGLAVGAWILPDLLGRSRGLDLALSGRWLDAEEAVHAGFSARIEPEPWERAGELAGALERADPDALARVKQVATRPHLYDALADERTRNRDGWSGHASRPLDADHQIDI